MPRKATAPKVTVRQRRELIERVDPAVWGLTRVGHFYDDRAEEEAGLWIDDVIETYGSVYSVVVDLRWNDAWRQRLNEYVRERRDSLRAPLCLHLYGGLVERVDGEPPMLHMIGESDRVLKHRLQYLVHAYFEGSYARMARVLSGIPYAELPWVVEPTDLETDRAEDGIVRTVVSRSRLQKAATFRNFLVRDDILAALTYIGVNDLWLKTGVGEPVTDSFEDDLYALRNRLGDSDMDAYLWTRQERSEEVTEAVRVLTPSVLSGLSSLGVWYRGDKEELAEKIALAVADARYRYPGDAEAVADSVEELIEREMEGYSERDAGVFRRALGRVLREIEPEAEPVLVG